MTKKILLSGIQPTGELHIGHYMGAMKTWVELQSEYDCVFILVDLHAITVRQDPEALRKSSYDLLALYLACGIDPEKSTVLVQSHVAAHAELAWVLNCFTQMGELSRMTQFKDKSRRNEENINVGLFDYPVLMAADILIYGSHLVPVGEDQKQHLELARDIAQRFNGIYGDVFVVPEPFIPKVGARIMSLTDPSKKMSKSDENPKSYIALLDPPDVIRNKLKRAVTDSGSDVVFDPEAKPAIANLMTIHSVISGKTFQQIESEYAGKGYGAFKSDLADLVAEKLEPVQERFREIRKDRAALDEILRQGAEKARLRARKVIGKVHRKLGFITPA